MKVLHLLALSGLCFIAGWTFASMSVVMLALYMLVSGNFDIDCVWWGERLWIAYTFISFLCLYILDKGE